MNENSHQKNKRIITVMMMVFVLAFLLFLSACSASKIKKTQKSSQELLQKNKETLREKKSQYFDFSTVLQEDYEIKYTPIDPGKEMGVGKNPKTGETTYTNVIPSFSKKTTATKNQIEKEITEAETNTTTELAKATKNETTKDKFKLSIPWYAFLILGFFGFATMIGLFLVHRILRRVKKMQA